MSATAAAAKLPADVDVLFGAAHRGNISLIREFIDAGADLRRIRDALGATPLHYAAAGGHVACCELLLSRGCPVDAVTSSGESALHRAAWANRLDAARLLLSRGASPSLANAASQTPEDVATAAPLIALLRASAAQQCGFDSAAAEDSDSDEESDKSR